MDQRLNRLEGLKGFTEREKDIYRYTIEQYKNYTNNGDIYDYQKEIDFDFVEHTDDAILQNASEKFGLSKEEVDKIVIRIESCIFN